MRILSVRETNASIFHPLKIKQINEDNYHVETDISFFYRWFISEQSEKNWRESEIISVLYYSSLSVNGSWEDMNTYKYDSI